MKDTNNDTNKVTNNVTDKNITQEVDKNSPIDQLEDRKAKILAIARSQGVPLTEGLYNASEEELKKLLDLLSAVKIMAEDPEDKTKIFVAAINALEGAKIIKGSGNLFNEYVVNATRKSYANFLEIVNQKEPDPSNWELFKGAVQLAADTFFALKTFRAEAHKKYPGLMALVVTLASVSASPLAAPVALAIGTFYTACKGVSTVLSFAEYEDNALELIKGGKEIKAKAEQALKDKKDVEKDQNGVSIESLANAFKIFEEKGIISAIASVSLDPINIEKLAAKFEGMTGQSEETSKKFVEALGSVMSDIPRSSADVLDFIKTLVPEGADIGSKGKSHLAKFTTTLLSIEDGTSGIRRLADTAIAFDKLASELKKDGIELPSAVTDITNKMIEVRKSIIPDTDKVSEAMGCGKSIILSLDRIASTMQPTKAQSRSPV